MFRKISKTIVLTLTICTMMFGGDILLKSFGNDTFFSKKTYAQEGGFVESFKRNAQLGWDTLGYMNPFNADNWRQSAASTVTIVKDSIVEGGVLVFFKIIHALTYLANKVLVLAGNLFDLSIKYSILEINKSESLKDAVNSVWIYFRDVINILFIFILLWVAIKTIIGLSDSGGTKKLLVSVIVAALFINFSLFITKVVLDVSNIFSVAIYSEILTATPEARQVTESEVKKSISYAVINGLGLPSQWNKELPAGETINAMFLDVVRLITVLITAWAFFVAAIVFISRIIIFIILMITSPIAFIGNIFPPAKSQAEEWKKQLSNQALVAPIFLFFILVIIKIINNKTFFIQNVTQISAVIYFNFFLIIGLLIFSVKQAKNLSGTGGEAMLGWTKSLTGFAAGAITGGTAGLAAFAGRASLGRLAAMTANSDKLKAAAAAGGVGGFASRMALKASTGISKSSFDARNTKVAELSKKKLGIDIGKGGKGGFVERRDEYAKKQTEFAKNSLSRNNLTEKEALEEHNEVTREKLANIDNLRREVNAAQNTYDDGNSSPEEKEAARLELEEKGVNLSLLEELNRGTILANSKDRYGNPLQTKEVQEARKKILDQRKKAYQEEYAKTAEDSVINKIRGANKAVSQKIGKDVVKGKSGAEQLQEAVEKAARDMNAQGGPGGNAAPQNPPPAQTPPTANPAH